MAGDFRVKFRFGVHLAARFGGLCVIEIGIRQEAIVRQRSRYGSQRVVIPRT
jgi:hypothetical protein